MPAASAPGQAIVVDERRRRRVLLPLRPMARELAHPLGEVLTAQFSACGLTPGRYQVDEVSSRFASLAVTITWMVSPSLWPSLLIHSPQLSALPVFLPPSGPLFHHNRPASSPSMLSTASLPSALSSLRTLFLLGLRQCRPDPSTFGALPLLNTPYSKIPLPWCYPGGPSPSLGEANQPLSPIP